MGGKGFFGNNIPGGDCCWEGEHANIQYNLYIYVYHIYYIYIFIYHHIIDLLIYISLYLYTDFLFVDMWCRML